MMRAVCIIPARMASGRFPGKPLKPLIGLPLVLHVFDRCRMSSRLERVVVATCDAAIREAVEQHGGEVIMTADSHPGAVDRTEEAITAITPSLAADDLALMVQGDEPLVTPSLLDAVIDAYERRPSPVINLASPILRQEDHDDPNCVKVAAALDGRALFFSRAPIPSRARTARPPCFQQTGIIGFSVEFLHRFSRLERTPLECAEHIDMLRVLEHGLTVQMVFADRETVGVDTPADLARAEELLRRDPVTARYLKLAS